VISATEPDPWGVPPWHVDFTVPEQPLPRSVDFVVVGGGFTGLAAAARLKRLAPGESVVLLEAGRIGAGASGRTGGIPLAESAAGDLPGLEDVLARFAAALDEWRVDCDLSLAGAWEIGRHSKPLANSPIDWEDSGRLRVVREVPGGTLDPGKLVSGLARAAHGLGAVILENVAVERVDWGESPVLSAVRTRDGRRERIAPGKILLATNAFSLGMAGLEASTHAKLALAALTAPVGEELLHAIGLSERKPFYTVDFPYLWGRVCPDNSILWGAGLVDPPDSNDVAQIRIDAEEPSRMFALLEQRVRGLHPALEKIRFTRYWGGPILFRDNWLPVFAWHPRSRQAVVLGAYAGHGVALSVHLGLWAAEVLLGRRDLPDWGRIDPAQ
jgi:gamma-glutamylputrescine oxidase